MQYCFVLALCFFVFYISYLLPKQKKIISEKEKFIAIGDEKVAQLQSQIQKLQEEISRLNLTLKNEEEKYSAQREKMAAFEAINERNLTDKQILNAKNIEQENNIKNIQEKLQECKEKNSALETSNLSLNNSKNEIQNLAKEKIYELEKKLDFIRNEKSEIENNLAALREQEPIRVEEHKKSVERLNLTIQNLEKERAKEVAEKEAAQIEKIAAQRATWLRHEEEANQRMKLICQELSIEYVDKEKFPFSGKPDNSVKICEEFIVFDSKSPQGDDLSNFPTYIRSQADQAKKYSKHEAVKKDIFFIVPTTALQCLDETYFGYATHRVHILSVDALRPILIQLKKIEDYEFAEKLSPEDREKIVTILGKMAHGMKRRVQVDHYFANEFISILTDAENLPTEVLERAREVERSSMLNPTIHKRSKRIEITSLKKDTEKLTGKAASQEIHTGPELKEIDNLPLFKKKE